jgi:O-acetyl-ADP-ribose deacetylase (regulator of RNase III)
MTEIRYKIGDATRPVTPGPKIICHICNDIGAWGAGFVLAVSKRWSAPEDSYRDCPEEWQLGKTQIVPVEDDILVANMIAQHGVVRMRMGFDDADEPPIRYDALRDCLRNVNEVATRSGATLHMPRIGCGLAGGEWSEVEKIIQEVCSVDVYVYDLYLTDHQVDKKYDKK